MDAMADLGAEWVEAAPAFHSYMQEMAELPAVNRDQGGIDIAQMAEQGGMLYVVGDMINPRILRMQRMILLRLLFLAKNRDQMREQRTICVFADEFKVHISRPFMTSLGASAGWGLHTILAFQSLQDLADCPADLNKDSVRGSAMENAAIQLSYAIKDPETAEWLSKSTGTILVDDESRVVEKNVALAETMKGERRISQSERFFIDTNMLMNLPKGCGVLATAGTLARFCYTSPVKAERNQAAITPTIPPQTPAVIRSAGSADLAEDQPEAGGIADTEGGIADTRDNPKPAQVQAADFNLDALLSMAEATPATPAQENKLPEEPQTINPERHARDAFLED